MENVKIVKNDLFDYKNRYIYQLEDAFKLSLDSILLAEFVKINNKEDNIIDLCTGNCPVPLILTTKYSNKIYAVEIQKSIFNLAKKSIEENKLTDNIKLINENVKNIFSHFKKASFDIVICNPPYFKIKKNSNTNENKILSNARHENLIKLEEIIKISSDLLKSQKSLYMVHRAVRLDEILVLCNKYNINVKKLVFIKTNEKNINTILVKCVKNSKSGLTTHIVDITSCKTYQNIFKEV